MRIYYNIQNIIQRLYTSKVFKSQKDHNFPDELNTRIHNNTKRYKCYFLYNSCVVLL